MDIDKVLSTSLTANSTLSQAISLTSLRRLARYHHYLVELDSKGVHQISGTVIGRDLGFLPVQVRKDLAHTAIVGKPGSGYQVRDLIRAIEECLGWNNVNDAFLVGAGSLGSALLGHQRFWRFGLQIVAAFDTDPNRVGRTIEGRPILPMEKLGNLAQRMGIHLGIITTPPESAQRVADEMVKSGIQAIWNFAPVTLTLPDSVFVHNEDLYSSLASLLWKLLRRFQSPISVN